MCCVFMLMHNTILFKFSQQDTTIYSHKLLSGLKILPQQTFHLSMALHQLLTTCNRTSWLVEIEIENLIINYILKDAKSNNSIQYL